MKYIKYRNLILSIMLLLSVYNEVVIVQANGVSADNDIETNTFFSGFYHGDSYLLYFDHLDGEKVTGWREIDGNNYYFLPPSGSALKGAQLIDDKIYFFDEESHAQVVGPATSSKTGKTYFYNKNGGIAEGLIFWEDKIYYGEPNRSGELVTGLNSADGELYYFSRTTGAALTDAKIVFSGMQMYFGNDGKLDYCKPAVGYEANQRVRMLVSAIDKVGDPFHDYDESLGWACGQFVRRLFQEQDYDITIKMVRNASYEQALRVGEGTLGNIVTEDELKPGDALYWSFSPCPHGDECDQYAGVHHAGIYLGNGKVVEASAAAEGVVVQDVREYESETSEFKIVFRVNMFNESKYDKINARTRDNIIYGLYTNRFTEDKDQVIYVRINRLLDVSINECNNVLTIEK